MHNEMLQVEGRKMSKSLGNFFTVRDLLDQGIPGEVIRFVFLSTHYRKPMDWTAEKAIDAKARLFGFVELISMYCDLSEAMKLAPEPALIDALADDLNTHAALECVGKMNSSSDANRLARNLVFLGVYSGPELESRVNEYRQGVETLRNTVTLLQSAREKANKTKDFSEVDRIKDILSAANVSVRMSKDDVDLRPEIDFDPAKLEALE